MTVVSHLTTDSAGVPLLPTCPISRRTLRLTDRLQPSAVANCLRGVLRTLSMPFVSISILSVRCAECLTQEQQNEEVQEHGGFKIALSEVESCMGLLTDAARRFELFTRCFRA